MMTIKSDPKLLERLRAAAKRGPTKAEMLEQKISYIASSLSNERTTVTREQVVKQLGLSHA
jgi:hypothetical protein